MKKYKFIGNPNEYNEPDDKFSSNIEKGMVFYENEVPKGWVNDVQYHVEQFPEDWEEVSDEDPSEGDVMATNGNINNIEPQHYRNGRIECIDALEAATVNKKGVEAVCTANIIKYLWRYESKNGLEDCKKAKWYLDKLIKHLENG